MILTEHKTKHGDVLVDYNEKILSFGLVKGYMYFWGARSDEETDKPANRYVVLNTGDEIEPNLHHIATLVEEKTPKHIFMYVAPVEDAQPRNITKIITDNGIEEFETHEEETDKKDVDPNPNPANSEVSED